MLIDEEEDPIQEYNYAMPGKRIFVALMELVNCWVLSYGAGFIFPHVYPRPLYLSCIALLLLYKIIAEKTGDVWKYESIIIRIKNPEEEITIID